MTRTPKIATRETTVQPSISLLLAMALGFLLTTACTIPGAIAPSTSPLDMNYVEISGKETSSSCGHTLLILPLGSPSPVSEVIEEMISSRGGDALIEVSSQSWTTWYLIGWANCFEITGKVVKVAR